MISLFLGVMSEFPSPDEMVMGGIGFWTGCEFCPLSFSSLFHHERLTQCMLGRE